MRIARVLLGLQVLCATGVAQQYVVSTYAGGAPPPTPVMGVDAAFGAAFGVPADTSGNVYFPSLNCVFKLDTNGVLTRVAGNSRAGYSGDGGPATDAQLAARWGVAVDGAGNLFTAEETRIRKISTSGLITTIAGNGTAGFSGDGGPAVNAQLNGAIAVAADNQGNLFIAEYHNNRIRKVDESGIITTVAGSGIAGYSGDGGPAPRAALYQVTGVAVDGVGSVFIATYNVIRKVTVAGIITSVATSAPVQPWGWRSTERATCSSRNT